MKGKVTGGKSFKGVSNYILDEGPKATGDKNAVIVSTNMGGHDATTFTREFSAVSGLRGDIQKPVFHVSLALPKGENLGKEKWEQVVKSYLSKMSIDTDNHQYMAAIHNDTEHQHVHIVVNRVGLDKKIFHGRQSAKNTIKAAMALETEFNLQLTHNPEELDKYGMPRKSAKKTPTSNELNMKAESARLKLQNIIDAATPETEQIPVQSFCKTLMKSGVTPIPNVTKEGKVNGFAFSIDGIKFKGSQLGEDYNWNKVLSNKVLATEDDAQYLLKLKRAATRALDSQDDLTKDRFKRFNGGYKNQAQRAYWAVYKGDISPEIADRAIIREFKSGDKQITIDGGKHRLLDRGDVIMLRQTDDMDTAIKAIIETGVAKGWGYSQRPFGDADFKKRFKEIQKQLKAENKLKQKQDEQIRKEKRASNQQHKAAAPSGNERNSSKRTANSSYKQKPSGTQEDARSNKGTTDANRNKSKQYQKSVNADAERRSSSNKSRTIKQSAPKATGSHFPSSRGATEIDQEKRAVEAAGAALSAVNDSRDDIADRIANDISQVSLCDPSNSQGVKKPDVKQELEEPKVRLEEPKLKQEQEEPMGLQFESSREIDLLTKSINKAESKAAVPPPKQQTNNKLKM